MDIDIRILPPLFVVAGVSIKKKTDGICMRYDYFASTPGGEAEPAACFEQGSDFSRIWLDLAIQRSKVLAHFTLEEGNWVKYTLALSSDVTARGHNCKTGSLTWRVGPFRLVRPDTLPWYQSPPVVLTQAKSPDWNKQ